MKKIKAAILQFLSGVELLIRGFSNRQVDGETIDLSIPAKPRIMSTYAPSVAPDFNSWAQHVHSEIQARYK